MFKLPLDDITMQILEVSEESVIGKLSITGGFTLYALWLK